MIQMPDPKPIIRLNYKWWVTEAINDYKSRVLVVTGGLGAGKTDGGSTWLHDRVTRNKRSNLFWFFEPTHQKIKDTAIPTYRNHLERMGMRENVHFRITKPLHWQLKYLWTGQEVHFHSYDRPELIVGTQIANCFLDEAGDADPEAYKNIRMRLRDPKATIRQFLVGGAPQGINWFADLFDSDTLPGWDTRVDRDHFHHKFGYRRFTLYTDDNADNLPDDYIQTIEDTYGDNPNKIKSYRWGQFTPMQEGTAVPNYLRARHDIEDIEASPVLDIYLSWDFNANPLAWVALQRIKFDEAKRRIQRNIVIHEANEGNTQLDESVMEFALKFPVSQFGNTKILIYGDSSGHAGSHKNPHSDYDNVASYLKTLGYKKVEIHAARSNPLETESIEAVQKWFTNDILYLCKRCIKLRRSLEATRWKEGKRKIDKPKNDTWTHWLDALKYLAYAESDFTGTPKKRVTGVNY